MRNQKERIVKMTNLALMARSGSDSDSDSTVVSLSDLKTQVHGLSKRKVIKLLLSLMDECQQMSVGKIEMSTIFSNLKYDYKVLKREKTEFENANKSLNAEIGKLEETVSVKKTETSNLMETISSLKAELITIKEGKTSSSEIINNDQGIMDIPDMCDMNV
ncbi:hypothetical protein HAX54_031771 [Datura stramonium]|uniref:Uncharacterized protein n=1 Tax=Datura stramonium TaxID=4076 RepID=A0ABS8VBM2_DATST|nr:hypothetical protein [Datura stramonium]